MTKNRFEFKEQEPLAIPMVIRNRADKYPRMIKRSANVKKEKIGRQNNDR